MPSTIKALDPNLRQQLAAMLSGDAKAGSVRADLVKGLIGSQTGDDSGLVSMTPLGAAFDMSAANRDMRQGGSGLGHTLSAAAGMIPGAGPEAHALEGLAEHAVTPEWLQKVAKSHMDMAIAEKGSAGSRMSDDGLDDYRAATQLAKKFQAFADNNDIEGAKKFLNTPGALMDNYSEGGISPLVHGFPAHDFSETLPGETGPEATRKAVSRTTEDAALLYDQSRMPKTSGIRAQLEAASKDNDKGATVVDAKDAPTIKGISQSVSKSTQPAPVTAHDMSRNPNDPSRQGAVASHIMDIQGEAKQNWKDLNDEVGSANHIAEVAGGDPKKLNFIKNAMQDEGGNVPEDVAATLLQHMAEKNPEAFNALHDSVDPHGKDPDLALNHLVDNHSIPEMLAMHYDLNPEQMSKAYAMPGPKTRPTQ